MLSITELFILFIMMAILVMFIQNHFTEVDLVTSKIDNNSYLVQKFYDKDAAADYLAMINQKLTKLIWHVKAKYPDNADVERLYKNYSPSSISEGSADTGYTSYSVNKGEKLVLCIRQRDRSFVDQNVLMYVAIHEIAHIMTSEVGHTPLFWENFRFLLNEAMEQGIYVKQNFGSSPQEYCGITISSSVV